MGFLEPSDHRSNDLVAIAPMIVKFGTDVKLD